ncbi:trypsin-like [Onthophagus taurus]|uniref:trypsin-like n=1 Tax=Onthophagus taurus TaxID=166361 RepID=UPI0039BEA493
MNSKILVAFAILLFISTAQQQGVSKKHSHKKKHRGSSSLKRIIGGTDVDISDYKYYVGVINAKSVFCGGALVTVNRVLTAAHCAAGKGTQPLNVFPGTQSFRKMAVSPPEAPYYNTSDVKIHEKYETKHYTYDIAILYLDKDVKLGGNVATIDVAPKPPPVGASVTLVGHGSVSCDSLDEYGFCAGDFSESLQKTDMKVSKVEDPELYLKMTPNRPCQGDSGGPFTYKGQLVAVASHSSSQHCQGTADVETLTSGKIMLKFLANSGITPANAD